MDVITYRIIPYTYQHLYRQNTKSSAKKTTELMKKGAAPRMRQLDHILSECSCLVLSVTKKDGSKGLA